MKRLHGKRIYVDSVGLRRGELDPFMVAVMEEIGIDVTRHRAKTFEDLEDDSFDMVISLSPEAMHKAVELTRDRSCEVEFWNTFDPSLVDGNRETRLDAYRAVRDDLTFRLYKRFPSGLPMLE